MVKNTLVNAGDTGDAGSILELGRSPGEGNGNLLQYSCLENSMETEGCGPQSRELQRVRHDGVTEHTHTWVKMRKEPRGDPNSNHLYCWQDCWSLWGL